MHATWLIQTSLLVLCRHSKHRKELSHYYKDDGEPVLTIVSNIGEDVHCTIPMVELSVYDVKSVSQPDTVPILENNYCLQIIGNRVAEQF